MCKRCGKCCKYASAIIPVDKNGKSDARWFELHGCKIKHTNGSIKIIIPYVCEWLKQNEETKEYYCLHYDERPEICRNYQCKL